MTRKIDPKATGQKNPWSDNFVGTAAEKEAGKAHILRTRGTALATALAKAAGYSVLGYKLKR
jgi:hypothetical protein